MSSSYARTHLVLAGALPVLVLVQATLAGRHLFEGSSISVHGIVGLVLAIVRRCDGLVFGVAVALMALAFAQVGLGFVGRETSEAAAWHIPVGVAIFGLTTYQLALLTERASAV